MPVKYEMDNSLDILYVVGCVILNVGNLGFVGGAGLNLMYV